MNGNGDVSNLDSAHSGVAGLYDMRARVIQTLRVENCGRPQTWSIDTPQPSDTLHQHGCILTDVDTSRGVRESDLANRVTLRSNMGHDGDSTEDDTCVDS